MLAAGLGSRFGGLKQCAPMGPAGETLLDYAVYDADQAGFSRVVFVLREEFAAEFMARARPRYGGRIQVDAVLQRPDDLPGGFTRPSQRRKPWGTTHAVLAARDAIDGPFGVVNADDFYGRDAYRRVAGYLAAKAAGADAAAALRLCMVGYPLDHTLSDHGGVNRGICSLRDDHLVSVQEHRDIVDDGPGRCRGLDLAGEHVPLRADAVASMNFWGFSAQVFGPMERGFDEFLQRHGHRDDAECYIPSVVDTLIRTGAAHCRVLHTDGRWFGVTYPQDAVVTARRLQALTDDGTYPHTLWP